MVNKNPKITYSNPADVVKVSEQGIRYIEDRMISEEMKERFKSNLFIRELSKKFDTFVFFSGNFLLVKAIIFANSISRFPE